MDNDAEVDLMAKAFAKAGYNYRTSVIRDHTDESILDGGVIIGCRPVWRFYHHRRSGAHAACAPPAVAIWRYKLGTAPSSLLGHHSKRFNDRD